MTSTLKVDELQNLSGQVLLRNGYPLMPGRVIEHLSGLCDGSVINGVERSYTWPMVNSQYATLDSYQVVPGSYVAYLPPPGTTRVIYKFGCSVYRISEHAITHFKFFIDDNEVVFARHNRSGLQFEERSIFQWTMAIGSSQNNNTGRQSSWINPKALSMQVRRYGGSNYSNLHGTTYFDGGGSNQFSRPTLSITAIA
jgi:hypothetical protein